MGSARCGVVVGHDDRSQGAVMAEPSIRVMVMHSSPIVRAGAAALLHEADDISVVGTADESPRAHQKCAGLDVDVVVVGPAVLESGPGAPDRRFEQLPDTRVVVLTDAIDETLVNAVSASGVDACLDLTRVDEHELVAAVHGVMHGQATFSSDFLHDLVQRHRDVGPPTPLTARENDILELLAQGQTNDAIANTLGLTTGTVRIYVSGILTKLGTPNRTAAAVLAIQEGLVDPTPSHA
jgi:DNA-binding NarL/FixJ family response regulator